jgi:hypothetical protein
MEQNQHTENQIVKQSDYMQMMPLDQMKSWYESFVSFTRSILKENLDFGTIPGCAKPSLYKPGAEKLRFVYGLGIEMQPIQTTVDLQNLFVDYTYKCTVRAKTGQILAECEGNCNSAEAKFGYLWVPAHEVPKNLDVSTLRTRSTGKTAFEFDFAIGKAETGGQYGKPAEYWENWKKAIQEGRAKKIIKKSKNGKDLDAWELNDQVVLYRIPNPDVVGQKNTIMKMAQKRAFVGAILVATGASEFFTQDIEDMEINGQIYSVDVPHTEVLQDAEVVDTKMGAANQAQPSGVQTDAFSGDDKSVDGKQDKKVDGKWYARTEKCTTVKDLLRVFEQYKPEIMGDPKLQQFFSDLRDDMKNKDKSINQKAKNAA